MYLTLISLAIALAVGGGGMLLDLWGWVGGILLGLLAFAATWILTGRRLRKRLEPAMLQIRKQTEAGMLEPAMRSLEDLLPLGRWFPLLTGQLHAQLGMLAHHASLHDRAREHLDKASKRVPEAQLLLATLHYRDGDFDSARTVLEAAAKVNRRHAMTHNFLAYLLYKEGQTDAAIARLNVHLKKEPSNEASTDNLLRLQNGQKMSMQRFGMEWYALGLEKPPASMGEVRTGRKGFRQPPKTKGRTPAAQDKSKKKRKKRRNR